MVSLSHPVRIDLKSLQMLDLKLDAQLACSQNSSSFVLAQTALVEFDYCVKPLRTTIYTCQRGKGRVLLVVQPLIYSVADGYCL